MRQRHGVVNCHLIDCIEQPLKSVRHGHSSGELFRKHIVVTPGDWPSQFYNTQLAFYEQFEPNCACRTSCHQWAHCRPP